MQRGKIEPNAEVEENRRRFLSTTGLTTDTIALVNIRYGVDYTYDVIETITSRAETTNLHRFKLQASDCIITNQPKVTLFLPVADCVATVVHDPVHNVIALAHLGRHSSVAKLANKLVERLEKDFRSKPEDLIIWMSPAIKPPHYTIERADFAANNSDWDKYCVKTDSGYSLDLQGYNRQLFINSGVLDKNIHISDVDTATDENYWSHFTSVTVQGELQPPRFTVIASLV